jgi:hypothetical protein
MTGSLTYNTYFGKYLLVGISETDGVSDTLHTGFYYSLSDDLIHWSQRRLLMEGNFSWNYVCGQAAPVRDPSVLDPESTDRNFGTTGQSDYLYFMRFNYTFQNGTCWADLDRDLIRIPIEFTKPPDPVEPAVQASPLAPRQGDVSPVQGVPSTASSVSAACSSARRNRARLVRVVRATRQRLAKARSRTAKARYRRLLKMRKRQLARARRATAAACG